MSTPPTRPPIPRAQAFAERAFNSFDRFLHIEAVSGLILLASALAALVWANSPAAASYEALWHTEFSIGIGHFIFSQSLHFWINDGLMTIFFLVVGMEIRHEMHDGSLSNIRQAALPVAAAMGGVVVPALIFLAVNHGLPTQHGWAVPTATDIAFAVGVLALLGKSIPSNVRIFLLALAIIDDIIAVLIIAVFYSGGLEYSGLILVAAGIVLVIGLQRIGIGSAYVYVIPGLVIWIGLLVTGAHPTLAGVVLGLMTPIHPTRMRERPAELLARATSELLGDDARADQNADAMKRPLKQLHLARRELLAPVVRVQMALHPWVAYAIMPLFALANAGVNLSSGNANGHAAWVMGGVILALTIGKPVGVIVVTWLMVRLGWCRLPPDVTWGGVCLIGLLAGIGFTMSIFIAMLAFSDQSDLNAAKLGVLLASVLSAIAGLAWGRIYRARLVATASGEYRL